MLKKDVFCAEFLALQHIEIWMRRFLDLGSYEPEEDVKPKKNSLFLQ